MAIQIVITNNGAVPELDEKGNELPDPKTPITILSPDGSLLTVLQYGACFGMAVDEDSGLSWSVRAVKKDDKQEYQEKFGPAMAEAAFDEYEKK